ncbi:MAG: SPASM domain-containing protein [Bacteroidetes bacterium]|nr:SPASM domain-containing protein [Bacteroidota bacterium]
MNANANDGLNYLKSLNLKRILNMLAVFISYYVARIIKKPVHWGMPISVSIEPTTSCNLRCPQCPSGLRSFSRETGMLEFQTFSKIIDELSPTLTYLTLYFQGEPYLNPDFLKFVSYASSKNIYTATSTNCHHMTKQKAKETVDSGLNRLIISIDGTTQEVYQEYRIGGNLTKVIEGTRMLVEAKREAKNKSLHIIWQFIVFKHNEHQIEQFKELAKSIGVDEIGIKTAQIYDFENGSDLIPENEKYSRYAKEEVIYSNGYSFKNKLLNHCWRMWQGCVFTWDGNVVPCCFDKDATHTLGNVNYSTFKSIWNGQDYNQFRKSMLVSRKEIDICKNCSEGTKVWN